MLMCKRFKLPLLALAATAVMLAAVGTASANRFSASNQGIRAVWTSMEFIGEGGSPVVRCPVTMEGSLHSRTIAKVRGSLIGHITRAIINGCQGGSVRFLTETLPWHLQYDSFNGTLPHILVMWMAVVGMRYLVEGGLTSCLYASTESQPALLGVSLGLEGEVNGVRWSTEQRIALSSGLLCPNAGSLGSSGFATLLGTNNLIFVRLI